MSYPIESYEKYMVPALFDPWSSLLVRSANPQSGERVLDVACGTGIVARKMVSQVEPTGKIIGLDINPSMIRVGRAAAQRENSAIEWIQGRAEQLGFLDRSFDLVVCQFGLMLFSDRRAALSGIHQVLKQGGRLVLSVWQGLERHPFYQKLHEVSRRRLGTSGVQAAFSLGDVEELRQLLEEAGFVNVEIEPVSMTAHFPNPQEFLAWEIDVDPASIPALRNLDPFIQQSALDAVRQELQAPLRDLLEEDQVVIPFHAQIARARR